jgi:DNA modification methylase
VTVRLLVGDALSVLRTLPAESVQLCVTSPPYFGLRAYGTDPQVWGGDPEHEHEWGESEQSVVGGKRGDTKVRWQHTGTGVSGHERLAPASSCPCGAWKGELGSERSPAEFISHLLLIFDEVWRVLRPDGLCFVNLGDSYSGSGKGPSGHNGIGDQGERQGFVGSKQQTNAGSLHGANHEYDYRGIPAKNLLLVPQRFAIAMQDRGWIVRSEIVWAKTSAMPESVRDRPTSAWEPIFMLSKSPTYFYDQEATRQPLSTRMPGTTIQETHHYGNGNGGNTGLSDYLAKFKGGEAAGANLRNVWTLGPAAFKESHFATFPPEIPRRCILAGSRPGDTVLDPFLGSGTTAMVADRLGRDAIGIELNTEYAEMARKRIEQDAGNLFGDPVAVEQPQQIDLFGEVAG